MSFKSASLRDTEQSVSAQASVSAKVVTPCQITAAAGRRYLDLVLQTSITVASWAQAQIKGSRDAPSEQIKSCMKTISVFWIVILDFLLRLNCDPKHTRRHPRVRGFLLLTGGRRYAGDDMEEVKRSGERRVSGFKHEYYYTNSLIYSLLKTFLLSAC